MMTPEPIGLIALLVVGAVAGWLAGKIVRGYGFGLIGKAASLSREMPPWGADPAHSLKMRNDRSLTEQQIDTIVAWVDGGAPRGSDADLPPPPTFATGWTAEP